MNRRDFNKSMLAGASLIAAPAIARADTVYNLKLGHFISPTHIFAKYLENWVAELKEKSNGRLIITIFPANEMGPVQNYADYARTGVADITWFLHGATPGRFPLTEIVQLPYMVGSAEIGTQTLNDPAVLSLLEPEYQGLKILYLLTHQPGNLHTTSKPVRTVDEMKGLRIRFASVTIKSFIAALGGTPVGVPPSGMADALQKGTIDGCFVDYGGADTAFHLGSIVKYTTEMYSYVSSFGVVMNPASYANLPPDLQKLIDDTTRPRAAEIGRLWDSADAPGKKYLMSEGDKPIELSREQDALFKKIGAEDTARVISDLDQKGMPASKVHAAMAAASTKYAATSFSFWKI
ncbi:MAG TPA: TRAP transporter substrate-binding protein [Xanthobacteraceae bacterium]|jgi:TRAP-type C4-dicarboxylate transport system substrate-binding protein|nr:TRAP transporter substrate-binding protein [Xanthobacteraceae bacterium]